MTNVAVGLDDALFSTARALRTALDTVKCLRLGEKDRGGFLFVSFFLFFSLLFFLRVRKLSAQLSLWSKG